MLTDYVEPQHAKEPTAHAHYGPIKTKKINERLIKRHEMRRVYREQPARGMSSEIGFNSGDHTKTSFEY